MDDVLEISLLLDFYGQVLTKRQYEILDLHYNSDYSLGEIAEQLNISRQGVYDNIKRGKAVLSDLESKLSLVAKFSVQREKAQKALEALTEIKEDLLDEHTRKVIADVRKSIREMIEGL